jgi:glycosyltransferase involved in cell wall biosynthesis
MKSLSVIIPCFNAEAYLGETLDSIQAQQLSDFEIIVLDDGSTDRSVEVARCHSAGVKVIQQTNQGPSAARQAGIAAASGELLAFCDADDVWAADRFPAQADFLLKFGASACCGMSQSFLTPELQTQHTSDQVLQSEYYRTFSALLIRRKVIEHIGRLPDNGPDIHIPFFARLQDHGIEVLQFNQVVTFRRVHANNLSRQGGAPFSGYARAIKGVLEDRREQARAQIVEKFGS